MKITVFQALVILTLGNVLNEWTAHLYADPPLSARARGTREPGDWLRMRDKDWPRVIQDAGRPVGGLVLVARVLPEDERFRHRELIVSIKNVSEALRTYRADRSSLPDFQILVRDSSNNPVPLTDEAARRLSGRAR